MNIDETIERLRAGITVTPAEQFRIGDALANLRLAVRHVVGNEFAPPNDEATRMAWLRAWAQGARMRGDL